jgi:hypothetical protein
VAIEPANKEIFSGSKHTQGKKHVCGRTFPIQPFWKNLGNTLFQLVVEHGDRKHADSRGWNTIRIPLMRKSSLNVQCSAASTELNALMTIFHAKEGNVN